jgi:hypothetical protein
MGLSEADLRQLEENQRRASAHVSTCCCVECLRQARRARHSEAELEATCTNILIQDGWEPLKTNPVSRRSRAAGFGVPGMCDYEYKRPIYIHSLGASVVGACQVLLVEWKSEAGENAGHQIDWQESMKRKGFLVVAAKRDFPATVDGFCEWYQRSGLKRGGQ